VCQPIFSQTNGPCKGTRFFIEARDSAFFPLSSKIRKIYAKVLNDVELELGAALRNNWRLWFDAGYVFKSGHSLGLHHRTKMQMVPFALGASYIFCNVLPSFDVFLGLGATYSFIKFHDHSEITHPIIIKKDFGAIAKSGFYYHFTNHAYGTMFVEYLFQRFHFNQHNTNAVKWHDVHMDGLKLGLGIGWLF